MRWLIVLIVILGLTFVAIPLIPLARQCVREIVTESEMAKDREEALPIIEAIHGADHSVDASWRTARYGRTDIIIRRVSEPEAQERIIACAKSIKIQRHFVRPVFISFRAEHPKKAKEPETILREITI